MSTAILHETELKTPQNSHPLSKEMKQLVERANRFSLHRDFEIIREIHGLPSKKEQTARKPK